MKLTECVISFLLPVNKAPLALGISSKAKELLSKQLPLAPQLRALGQSPPPKARHFPDALSCPLWPVISCITILLSSQAIRFLFWFFE